VGRRPLPEEERAARTRAILDAERAIAEDRDAAQEALPAADWSSWLAAAETVRAYPWRIRDRDVADRLDWTVRQVKAARLDDPAAFVDDVFRPPPAAVAVLAAIADHTGYPRSRLAIRMGVDPRAMQRAGGPVYAGARAFLVRFDVGAQNVRSHPDPRDEPERTDAEPPSTSGPDRDDDPPGRLRGAATVGRPRLSRCPRRGGQAPR
jgi:hypothetical protein